MSKPNKNKKIQKSDNKEIEIVKSLSIVIKSVNEKKRQIEGIATYEQYDDENDLVLVAGIDLERFIKNPLLLWFHQLENPPIGKIIKIWKDRHMLKFIAQYATKEEYGFADTIYQLTIGGYIKAFSMTATIVPGYYEYNEKGGRTVSRCILKELSACCIPINMDSLVNDPSIRKAVKKGVIDKIEFNEFEMEVTKGYDDYVNLRDLFSKAEQTINISPESISKEKGVKKTTKIKELDPEEFKKGLEIIKSQIISQSINDKSPYCIPLYNDLTKSLGMELKRETENKIIKEGNNNLIDLLYEELNNG